MSDSIHNADRLSISIDVAADSDIGLIRPSNQDVAMVYLFPEAPSYALLAVADGMGGHRAGHLASRLATEALLGYVQTLLDGDDGLDHIPPPPELLKQAVHVANQAVRQYASVHREEAGDMGSTLTCALIADTMVTIANVGDSRAYHFSNGLLYQVTQDHSLVAELVRRGELPPEAILLHPQRNIITRALGMEDDVQPDIWIRQLEPGDWLLLCSDGLWEMVPEDHIASILESSHNAAMAVRRLIDAANERGGLDNIGVAVARLW
ncbi:MAG: Stp1/IreP family PP2C-type Ser/Thr phosphatase [Ardenticatenia bacterium]|nr:Stp1/IreP family PP2C-type Ser/Thr phosphatase [Ardenticatenia bacterium]